MLAFEITINGQRRIVAATTPNKVLGAGLSWTQHDNDRIELNIGGITEAPEGTGNHFAWDVPKLTIGDEISIRIVDSDSPDEPDRIYNHFSPRDSD